MSRLWRENDIVITGLSTVFGAHVIPANLLIGTQVAGVTCDHLEWRSGPSSGVHVIGKTA